MRINIVTQPLFINYGGILQNYALQHVIRMLGHEPRTINVAPVPVRKAEWKDYVKIVLNLVSKLRGKYSAPFLNPHTLAVRERELSFPQREFVRKYINKIDVKAPFTPETVAYCPADMWIVGSDQVWRPWCNIYIENEFFDFLDESTPRIAYGASFGTDQWEIPVDKTPQIKELAKKFKAVSVREKTGVKLCKDYMDIAARHVLDPTMLLTSDDYIALTSESDYPHYKYITTYILDTTKEKSVVITDESRRKNLPIIKIGVMRRNGFDRIETWLATLAHAEYVITDSFHGTVFSLIFGRPVKILKNGLRGNSRFDSLLSMLKIAPSEDGFIYPDDNFFCRLGQCSKQSIEFLSSQLS